MKYLGTEFSKEFNETFDQYLSHLNRTENLENLKLFLTYLFRIEIYLSDKNFPPIEGDFIIESKSNNILYLLLKDQSFEHPLITFGFDNTWEYNSFFNIDFESIKDFIKYYVDNN